MPSATWTEFLNRSLQRTDAARRRRVRRIAELDGKIDFGSNDYLGLRSHSDVIAALRENVFRSWGAGASPVLSGYTSFSADLESALAEFSQSESALVFSSGYACNVGTIACLAGAGDLILSDQLNHASLIDGCRLSKAQTVVYPHHDLDFVRAKLAQERHHYAKVLVITESIFSMDGDAARLVELVALAEQYDCGLVVDEAHAVGVYGANGGGLLEELNLQTRVLAKLGTLSKAIGCIGGYVAGPQAMVEYVVNHCRSYLFSTSAPGPSLAAASKALELLRGMHVERELLRQKAKALRQSLHRAGWSVVAGDSPIVPLIVGSEQRVLELSQLLWQAGMYVPGIRPPTVPEGTCRLRISLSARHSMDECQRLVAAISKHA